MINNNGKMSARRKYAQWVSNDFYIIHLHLVTCSHDHTIRHLRKRHNFKFNAKKKSV